MHGMSDVFTLSFQWVAISPPRKNTSLKRLLTDLPSRLSNSINVIDLTKSECQFVDQAI